MDIISLIDSYAGIIPNKIAFQNRSDKATYRELKVSSDFLAKLIYSKLSDDRSPIIIRGHKEPLMPACFLASVKSGHPYIPVDASVPIDRIKDILANSQAKLLINLCADELNLDILALPLKALKELLSLDSGNVPLSPVCENDDYYIKYTSGSTGKPKGVRITYNNLSSFLRWAEQAFQIQEEDIIINQALLSFDLSVLDLYLGLCKGATLNAIDAEMLKRPAELFDYLEKSNATVIVSTPSFIEFCLYERRFNKLLMPNLKKIIFCGELLLNECVTKLFERFSQIDIYNSYGPTEATVAVTAIKITSEIADRYNPLPIGHLTSNIKLEISENKHLEKREIIIQGPTVSPGYLNDLERTSVSFYRSGNMQCYKTGDLGYIENELLFYYGRIDNQVKLSGHRIELEDIENKISTLNYVRKCVVLPKVINGKCQSLTAFILNKSSEATHEESSRQLKSDLKSILPQYMIPGKIHFVDNFPMTANGKVDKNELKKLI